MARTLDSLLSDSGYTLDQARSMDRSAAYRLAGAQGFSQADVDAFLGPAPERPTAQVGSSAQSSDGGTPVVAGFGGRTQWEVLEEHALMDRRAGTSGFAIVSDEEAENPGRYASPLMAGMAESLDRMSRANAALISGEIPADVSSAVRRSASESSITRGSFGASARALSARDLGRTSLDVMKQGQEQQTAINNARLELGKTYEAIKKTNLARNQEIVNMESNIASNNREVVSLERQRIATNINSNVQTLQLLGDLVSKQQLYMVEAAKEGIDTSPIRDTFDSWIAAISRLIS